MPGLKETVMKVLSLEIADPDKFVQLEDQLLGALGQYQGDKKSALTLIEDFVKSSTLLPEASSRAMKLVREVKKWMIGEIKQVQLSDIFDHESLKFDSMLGSMIDSGYNRDSIGGASTNTVNLLNSVNFGDNEDASNRSSVITSKRFSEASPTNPFLAAKKAQEEEDRKRSNAIVSSGVTINGDQSNLAGSNLQNKSFNKGPNPGFATAQDAKEETKQQKSGSGKKVSYPSVLVQNFGESNLLGMSSLPFSTKLPYLLREQLRRNLSKGFYLIQAKANSVDMRTRVQYFPPSMLEDGTRDVSLNLKGRIVQSLLDKNKTGNSLRRNLFRWWVKSHKEYISMSVKKVAIMARISPEIAIYRMRYLIEKARMEKRKVYNEMRIKQFIDKMEKICDPVPMRHKAYVMRKLLAKDPRLELFSRLALSQKCKLNEALRNLRLRNSLFKQSMNLRQELILVDNSLGILVGKSEDNLKAIFKKALGVGSQHQKAVSLLVESQALRQRKAYNQLVKNMTSGGEKEKKKREKIQFILRRIISGSTGKEANAIEKLQANRISKNELLSQSQRKKHLGLLFVFRAQQAKLRYALNHLRKNNQAKNRDDIAKNNITRIISRKMHEKEQIGFEKLKKNSDLIKIAHIKRHALLDRILARAPKMRKENTLVAYMAMLMFAQRRRIFDAEHRGLLKRVFNRLYNQKGYELREAYFKLVHHNKQEKIRDLFFKKRIISMLHKLYSSHVDSLRSGYMKLVMWAQINKPADGRIVKNALAAIFSRLERNWKRDGYNALGKNLQDWLKRDFAKKTQDQNTKQLMTNYFKNLIKVRDNLLRNAYNRLLQNRKNQEHADDIKRRIMNKMWRLAFNSSNDLMREALQKLREWRKFLLEVEQIKAAREQKKSDLVSSLVAKQMSKEHLALLELGRNKSRMLALQEKLDHVKRKLLYFIVRQSIKRRDIAYQKFGSNLLSSRKEDKIKQRMGTFFNECYFDRLRRALNKLRWNREVMDEQSKLHSQKQHRGLGFILSRLNLCVAKAYYKLCSNKTEKEQRDSKIKHGLALLIAKIEGANKQLQIDSVDRLQQNMIDLYEQKRLQNSLMKQLVMAQRAKEQQAYFNLHHWMLEEKFNQERLENSQQMKSKGTSSLLNKIFRTQGDLLRQAYIKLSMWNALQREKEKEKFAVIRRFFKRYFDPDNAHEKWKALQKLRNWNHLMKEAETPQDRSKELMKWAVRRMIRNSKDELWQAYKTLQMNSMRSRYDKFNDDKMKEKCTLFFKRALYGKLLLAYKKLVWWNTSQQEKTKRVRELMGSAIARMFDKSKNSLWSSMQKLRLNARDRHALDREFESKKNRCLNRMKLFLMGSKYEAYRKMLQYRAWKIRRDQADSIKKKELFNHIERKQAVRLYLCMENFKNWSFQYEINRRSKDHSRKLMKEAILKLIKNNGNQLFLAYQLLKQHSIGIGKSRVKDQFIRDRLQQRMKNALFGKLYWAYTKLIDNYKLTRANGENERKLMMKMVNKLLMNSGSRLWAAYQKLRLCAHERAMIQKNQKNKLTSIIQKGGLGKKWQAYAIMISYWRNRKAYDQRRFNIINGMFKGLNQKKKESKVICYLKMRAFGEYSRRQELDQDRKYQLLKFCCFRIKDGVQGQLAYYLNLLRRLNDQKKKQEEAKKNQIANFIEKLVNAQKAKQKTIYKTIHANSKSVGEKDRNQQSKLKALFMLLEKSQSAKMTQAVSKLQSRKDQEGFNTLKAKTKLSNLFNQLARCQEAKARKALSNLRSHNRQMKDIQEKLSQKTKQILGRIHSKCQDSVRDAYNKLVNNKKTRNAAAKTIAKLGEHLKSTNLEEAFAILREHRKAAKERQKKLGEFFLNFIPRKLRQKTEQALGKLTKNNLTEMMKESMKEAEMLRRQMKLNQIIKVLLERQQSKCSDSMKRLLRNSNWINSSELKVSKMDKILSSLFNKNKIHSFNLIVGNVSRDKQDWRRKIANFLNKIIIRKQRESFDAIYDRSEHLRLRRIELGMQMLANLANKKYVRYRNHFAEAVFKISNINPWIVKSIKKLTIDAPLSLHSTFWRIRELNNRQKKSDEPSYMLRKAALKKFAKIFKGQEVKQYTICFFKLQSVSQFREQYHSMSNMSFHSPAGKKKVTQNRHNKSYYQ